MKSTIKSRNDNKKRWASLPYDPLLVSGKNVEQDVPGEWRIERDSASRNGILPNAVLAALKTRTSPTPLARNGQHTILASAESQLQHLLARASFGISVEEMKFIGTPSLEDTVEALLLDLPMPDPPGEWVSEGFDRAAYRQLTREEQQAWRQQNRQQINELRGWWLELMMGSAFNLREKMTLFWHGHFTSDTRSAFLSQYVYLQNDTLRRFAMGNFRDFVKAIYKDPAMLLYLNGVQNQAREPNENFARELLELFTMGVGNYTESDIKELARAFTGWQLHDQTLASFLNLNRWDSGVKTVFGRSGNFSADEVVDIILEQPQTAIHICRKLYEFLVSREVDEDFVQALATTFRDNNYEIKPVLREIFTSELFYGDQAVGSLIKSPTEMAVANARMLSVDNISIRYIIGACEANGQTLFNPPNVAGWPGQRSWISPTTFVTRNTFSDSYIVGGLYNEPYSRRSPIEFDALAFARNFEISDARGLADAMAKHLLRMPVSDQVLELLVTVLVGSADPADWSLDYEGAEKQVESFLQQVVKLPEFHLT